MYTLRSMDSESEDSWLLSAGKNLVGRAADCGVRVDDPRVSRHHACLNVFDDHIAVTDAGSRNGVFVNGRRVMEGELKPGDRLGLGPVTLIVLEAGAQQPRPRGPRPEQPVATQTQFIERGSLIATPVVDGERLQLLYDIVDTVVGTLHVDQVLPSILDVLDRLFSYERCAIASRDSSGELVIRASRPAQTAAPFSRTVVERVLDRGEGLVFDDIQGQSSFNAAESVVGLNIRSVLCAPMVSRGEMRGLVYLDRSVAGAYDANDLALLRGACQLIAIALENAHLYEDLQNRYENKTNELREVERRLVESEQAAALGRLTQTIAHEIRNPITVIGGMTRRIAARITDPDLAETAAAVLSETERLERMVRRVEAVVELPEPKHELLPLESTVDRSISALTTCSHRDVDRVNVSSRLARRSVPHDPALTRIALTEVLQNAYRALPADGELTVAVEEGQEGWMITVREAHAGAARGEFRAFFDSGLAHQPWADDLALTLAHEAMVRQGGEIRMRSEAETGIEVQLILTRNPPEAVKRRKPSTG